MSEQITELVEFAERHREVLDDLRSDCDVDIFCAIFSGEDAQGGFTMPVDLLRRLADLRLEVTFDLY